MNSSREVNRQSSQPNARVAEPGRADETPAITPAIVRLLVESGGSCAAAVIRTLHTRGDVNGLREFIDHPHEALPAEARDALLSVIKASRTAQRESDQILLGYWNRRHGVQASREASDELARLAGRIETTAPGTARELAVLLASGADPQAPSGPGKLTPVGVALDAGGAEALSVLLAHTSLIDPGRWPQATDKLSAIEYMVRHTLGSAALPALVNAFASAYDLRAPSMMAATSAALRGFFTREKDILIFDSRMAGVVTLVAAEALDTATLRRLWTGRVNDSHGAAYLIYTAAKMSMRPETAQLALQALRTLHGSGCDFALPSVAREVAHYATKNGSLRFVEEFERRGGDLSAALKNVAGPTDRGYDDPAVRPYLHARVARDAVTSLSGLHLSPRA